MNRGRVGEEREGKETDICPLTTAPSVLPLEVMPPRVPIKELTRSSSPSSMLPEALSEALGVSLSEVLDRYYSELDEDKRGRMIGDALDRKRMGNEDQGSLDQEARRHAEEDLYRREPDDTY
jgi:hypothetical protein